MTQQSRSNFKIEMLLPFIISQLIVLTIANPFHKYPYVFLLDVGNEEIEKTRVEQIRLTIPGGSMAIKYPGAGEGDLIGHVRVSGIDFGTDLKASIVEGGPGYKYVVIVFSGNPGNSYDAVVTIQKIPFNSEENDNSPINSDKDNDDDGDENDDDDDDTKEIDDNENKIENTNDSGSMTVYTSADSEVMQSSSNIYKYAVNDEIDSQKIGDNDDDDNDNANEENNNNDSDDESDNSYVKDDDSGSDVSVNDNSDKYTAFKPHFFGGIRFYPQAAVYAQSAYGQSDDDSGIPVYENGDNQDDTSKNSKNFDIDYASPVEY